LRRSALYRGLRTGSNPSGSTFYFKHIEKVGPLQGAAHGSNPSGSTFYFKHIEKVGPYQGAAHGFESPWVHRKSTFPGAFLNLTSPLLG